MARRIACMVALSLVLTTWGEAVALAKGRFSDHPARIVTATYLGGGGTEWLSAGVFLPSGEILVCGVTIDAEVTVRGVKARVIGTDAPALRPRSD